MTEKDTVTRTFTYTDVEYNQIVETIKDLIPKLTDKWSYTGDTDLGMTLVKAFAGIGDMLVYYLNEQAKETYLPTARIRQSVIDLTNLIGYDLSRPKSAYTEVRLTMPPKMDEPLVLNKYDTFSTRGDKKVVFSVTEEHTIPMDAGQYTIPLLQGQPVREVFTGTGEDHQEISLNSISIGNDLMEVIIGDQSVEQYYELKKDTYLSNSGKKFFKLYTDMFDRSTLIFDSSYGGVPKNGEKITVRYVECLGTNGEISRGTLVDSSRVFPSGTALHHPMDATNGSDRETIARAKVQAPREIRTLWRAVTPEDYSSLLEGYPGILKCKIGENETDPSIPLHRVKCFVVTESGDAMTPLLKKDLEDFLSRVKMITTRPEVMDAKRASIDVKVSLYVYGSHVPSTVVHNVKDRIHEFFHPKNREFGEVIYPSMLSTWIDTTDGVSHLEIPSFVEPLKMGMYELPELNSLEVTVEGVI